MDKTPKPTLSAALRPSQAMLDREIEFLAMPDAMDLMCTHLANGGDVIDLCEGQGVRYGVVINWVNKDPKRIEQMREARLAWAEWGERRIKLELQRIGLVDIRKIFNEDHSIKPPSEWPADVAAALVSIDVDELTEGAGKEREQIGWTKKVKLASKVEALKLLGQQLGMFVNKHEVKGTLEDLVAASLHPKNTSDS